MSLSDTKKENSSLDLEHVNTGPHALPPSPPQLGWSEQFRVLWSSKRSVLTALACSTTPILIGYDLTLIGSIIANKQFVKQFGVFDDSLEVWTLPAERQLIWTVVQFVAAIVSALGSGQLNDVWGRRLCFYMTVGCAIASLSPYTQSSRD